MCKWKECNFETQNNKEISRHVYFHSYHTKLKAIGVNVHLRYFLAECIKNSSQRNHVPELLSDFKCCWIGCTMAFSNIQVFSSYVNKNNSLGLLLIIFVYRNFSIIHNAT